VTVATARLRSLATPRVTFLALAFVTIGAAGALGLVAGERPAIALLAAGAGLAALLSAARPDVATLLVVAILYSNAGAVAVRTYGVPYFFAAAFPVALIAPFAYHVIARRRPFVVTPAMFFLLGLSAVYVVGTVFSRDTRAALDGLFLFATSGVGLYIAMVNVVRDVRTLRRIVFVVLAVSAVLGSLSMLQTATGSYGNDFFGFAQVNWPGIGTTGPTDAGGTPRAAGPIGEQNRWAQVLLVLVPIGAFLALRVRPRIVQLGVAGATGLVLLGVGATFSRGAALGMVAVLGLLVAYRYVRIRHLAVLALAGVLILALFPRYAERLANLEALTNLEAGAQGAAAGGDVGNLRSRATQMLTGVLIFIDHPLIGVGPGMYSEHYQRYADKVDIGLLDARVDPVDREAHSLYAEILAEGGALGTIFFLGMVGVTLVQLHRARNRWLRTRPDLADLAAGFLFALTAYMGSAVFLHLSYERYFWLLMALAGVTAHLLLHAAEEDLDPQPPYSQSVKPNVLPKPAGLVGIDSP
jgi:O-antigen ligase